MTHVSTTEMPSEAVIVSWPDRLWLCYDCCDYEYMFCKAVTWKTCKRGVQLCLINFRLFGDNEILNVIFSELWNSADTIDNLYLCGVCNRQLNSDAWHLDFLLVSLYLHLMYSYKVIIKVGTFKGVKTLAAFLENG